MSTRKAKLSFEIKRFRDFLSIFRRDKRGVLGVIILVFFIAVALMAPLITPYNPTRLSGPLNPPIAFREAKPIWYKYLPGAEPLSENLEPMQDPHFNTADSIEELEFASNSTSQSISLQYISDQGRTENGCVALVFNRNSDEDPSGSVASNLTKVFQYPYIAPSNRFLGEVALLITGAEDVPIKIDLVLEKEGSERRLEWWSQTFNSSGTTWVIPEPPIDSTNKDWIRPKFGFDWSIDPARKMFAEPANYRYGLEITFNDTRRPKGEEVEATVYIDDFRIQLFGSSFGLLGTDQLGRDIFTQLVYGTQISLIVGLLAALFSTAVGLLIGLSAGYVGGLTDQILMRFTDLLLVIPDTPLYIVLMAVIRPSVFNLVLLITLIGWTGFARIVRSQTLSLKERPFVEAAKAVGAGKFRIIMRHIVPNVMSLVYVTLATSVPYAITSEAWLSWLGLYDPYVMTWGRMLYDVQNASLGVKMWWWVVPPGLCIAALSLSFILFGYALDEILNPKLRKRR
ncbi:MAG: ABC transporter permease [Candidatus Bathyarchaeota archaeon]